MRKRREANRSKWNLPSPRIKDLEAMEIDNERKGKETQKCYSCNKTGHLTRKLPRKRETTGFLVEKITTDCNTSCHSQVIEDTLYLDDIHLNNINYKQQLLLLTGLEELKTKRTASLNALLDSGCVQTCIDKEYARQQGWPLLKIQKPIKV
jgi:hypothetical protein